MHKIRYHKLRHMLRERHITMEALRKRIGLLASDIVKLETERLIDPIPMMQLCRYLECDIFDLLDIFPEEERDTFYSKHVLESHSYVPRRYVKKEFVSSAYQ
ncbi:MAG: helix-turn-helix transcriptional regulator [Clostridia bacterium]|nr:helix-turn-helix transcriptional regulator [Clostridia bacterium]